MDLNEAEIQVLASIYAAEVQNGPVDLASLKNSGKRYLNYLEDWSGAFTSLTKKGLISGDDQAYQLTDFGRPLGLHYFEQRPDSYWYYYRDFYDKAHVSKAHSKFCKLAFGLDLTQEGQMDMDGIHDLLDRLQLKPGQSLLDLGCGAGGISEYISDQTGAHVTGLDNSQTAVFVANERTKDKHDRLKFFTADLNRLDLDEHAYDAAVSIDTIYWVNDTVSSIQSIVNSIKPGGQLIIIIVQIPDDCNQPEDLEIENTFVAKALDTLELNYQAVDVTESFLDFWPRVKRVLTALKQDFESEGNLFIYENLMREAETEYIPAVESGSIRRYLYHVGR